MKNPTISPNQIEENENLHLVDDSLFFDMFYGIVPTNVMLIALELQLFELLNEQALRLEEICQQLSITARSAQAVLSVLLALKVLDLNNGEYRLNAFSQKYLVQANPYYYGKVVSTFKDFADLFSYEAMKKLILSGQKQIDPFGLMRREPGFSQIFTDAMHGMSMAPGEWWVNSIDLSDSARFLDIAGGSGAHAITAVQKWSQLEAIVLDMASVCTIAEQYISKFDLSSKCKAMPYDLWTGELPGADVHFYSNIFHDWSYEQGEFLASKSYDSLEKGGKIIIHELLYEDDKQGPLTVANFNFSMLATMEGQQYSGPELESMLVEVGFSNIEIIPTKGYWSIVTGEKN